MTYIEVFHYHMQLRELTNHIICVLSLQAKQILHCYRNWAKKNKKRSVTISSP